MNIDRNFISISFGVLFAMIFAYFAFHGLDISKLQETVMSLQAVTLVAALCLYALEHFFRLIRWWKMMRELNGGLSLKDCAAPYFISVSVNHLVPIRIGDLIRIFTYRKTINIQPSKRAGIVMVERVIDFLVFLIFFYAGLLRMKADIIPIAYINSAIVLTIISLFTLLIVLFFSNYVRKACFYFLDVDVLKRLVITAKIREWTGQFFDSLTAVGSPRFVIKLFLISFIMWLTETGMFFVVIRDISPGINPLASFFAFAVAALSSVFPAAPGMIGTLDYFLMLGVLAYGMKRVAAASFAVVIHVYFLVSALAIAVYYFFDAECRNMFKDMNLLWSRREIRDAKGVSS